MGEAERNGGFRDAPGRLRASVPGRQGEGGTSQRRWGRVPTSKGQGVNGMADKVLQPEPDRNRFKSQLCHLASLATLDEYHYSELQFPPP